MTIQQATEYAAYETAKANVVGSQSLDLFEKARILGRINELAQQNDVQRPVGLADVMGGLVGAGVGAGIARTVSSLFGLSDRFSDKLETAAMGLGAYLNTGMNKRSNDMDSERLAFRIGFLKAATQQGYFKEAGALPVPVVAVTPESLLEIPRGFASATIGASRGAGALLGALGSDEKADRKVTEIDAQDALLRNELAKQRALRTSRLIAHILANRKKAVPKGA